MRKRIVVAVVLAVLFAMVSAYAQSAAGIVIIDSDGNKNNIPNSTDPSLTSNMTDVLSLYGINWHNFDYQAAVFNEFHDSDRFVLQGTVQQIVENPDDTFTYFVYLSNWNSISHGNLSDEAAIETPERVKGLDVDKNGIFYCQYDGTKIFLTSSVLTGQQGQLKLPTFKASLFGLKLDMAQTTQTTHTAQTMDSADIFKMLETPETVQAAINKGVDVNARDENGAVLLMYAASYNKNPEVISALLKAGADIKARDTNGQTALIWAARDNKNPEMISALLKAGADINAYDKSGMTSLMYAANRSENPEVVLVLLKAGADGKMKDNSGETAFDVSKYNPSIRGTDAYKKLEEASK